jgi:hypothetical protein
LHIQDHWQQLAVLRAGGFTRAGLTQDRYCPFVHTGGQIRRVKLDWQNLYLATLHRCVIRGQLQERQFLQLNLELVGLLAVIDDSQVAAGNHVCLDGDVPRCWRGRLLSENREGKYKQQYLATKKTLHVSPPE